MKRFDLCTQVVNVSFDDLQKTIGSLIKYKGLFRTVGAIYVYSNKFGIVSCRIRFVGSSRFVNVVTACKVNNRVYLILEDN